MLSKHFEAKLAKNTPKELRKKYTLEDAQADARLLLAQTEDRAYPLGRLEPLCEDDPELHATVRFHYERLRVLSLGAAYSAQILGNQAPTGSDTAATITHADAVSTIGGGTRALSDSLPLNITLPAPQRSPAALTANSLKQLSKDVERDRLIINGQYVVGAEMGLAGIQQVLLAAIEQTILSHDVETRSASQAALHELVLQTLAKASRTNSGGSSFLALQPLLAPGEQAMPLSELATPLCVRVSVHALPPGESISAAPSVAGAAIWCTAAPPSTSMALLCEVDCATYYRIQDSGTGMGMGMDDPSDAPLEGAAAPDFTIQMKYRDSVYLHVNYDGAERGAAPQLGARVREGLPRLAIQRYELRQ